MSAAGQNGDYLNCVDTEEFCARIHQDAADGIARDIAEGNAEVGGLLLGLSRVANGKRDIQIERYGRLEFEHTAGPEFVLDDAGMRSLEETAAGLTGVIGLYRSNTRAALRLSEADLELAARYFPDTGDVVLLIQAGKEPELQAQFFERGADGEFREAGEEFVFRGRVIAAERPRRLIPDFLPAGESPRLPVVEPLAVRDVPEAAPASTRRWWPLAGALALVGVAIFGFMEFQRGDGKEPAAQTEAAGPVRPVGLYVDPVGDSWRISWNASATALQSARSVALFVREGEDQNRIDLTPQDLQSGTYQYQPKPGAGPEKDVTFRLETVDANGHLSAESFRLLRVAAPAAAVSAPQPAAPPAAHAKAIHKVAPVIPASIRPRIHGSMAIDIRVKIDNHGRVVTAAPVTKPRSGLQSFLAGRAVAAAREWRFENREATEVLHFVFER